MPHAQRLQLKVPTHEAALPHAMRALTHEAGSLNEQSMQAKRIRILSRVNSGGVTWAAIPEADLVCELCVHRLAVSCEAVLF